MLDLQLIGLTCNLNIFMGFSAMQYSLKHALNENQQLHRTQMQIKHVFGFFSNAI